MGDTDTEYVCYLPDVVKLHLITSGFCYADSSDRHCIRQYHLGSKVLFIKRELCFSAVFLSTFLYVHNAVAVRTLIGL